MKHIIAKVNALTELMEEERRLLLAGDVAAFDRLAERKDKALAQLMAALADSPGKAASRRDDDALETALQALRGNARRSGDLIAAALDGLRDAEAFLTAMREMRLDTYTADGGRESHQAAKAGRLERRA